MTKSTGQKIAIGAAIAGAVGYVAGILTAPKSGKETRTDIKNATAKAKTEAEKKLKALYSELDKNLEIARKHGSELTGKAKVELEKALESADVVRQKVRELLSALHDGDADDPELKKALKDAKDAIKNLEKFARK